ncbi:MAG: arylsulfatase [Rubripirellula sp.]|jgi:arylsulfatase
MRRCEFGLFPAVYVALLCALAAGSGQAAERPNIVVILADDLGYSDLGCFGSEIETPRLDQLAFQGLRMTQLYNAARCCSTRASLLTGLYPHQAGVGAMSVDNQKPGYRGFLTDRAVCVSSLLRDAGYQTFMAGKWHLRGKGNQACIPTNHGFDEFFGHFKAYASYYRSDLFERWPAERTKRQYKPGEFYATDAITDHAVDFIKMSQGTDDPFFLYVAYNAPHFPLQAPRNEIQKGLATYRKGWDAVREMRIRKLKDQGLIPKNAVLSQRGHVTAVPERNADSPYYDREIPAWDELTVARKEDLANRMATYAAMVRIMDRNIGRIIDCLARQGCRENTLIVFLSDNGACAEWDPLGFDNNPYPRNRLYDGDDLQKIGGPGTFHSYGTGWANASNSPFRLYKHYNHEGGISSPTIISWPKQIKRAGELERAPTHVIDLAPTFLELANADYPDGSEVLPLAGRSLLNVWQGVAQPERTLYFEHEGNRAVRRGNWKLVWINYLKRWELYDIELDRTESNDLAQKYPELVAEFEKLWLDWARENFVERHRVEQPATGMPKIYYW